MDALNSSKPGFRRILVLGLGGAGCNTIARIAPRAPEGMEFAVMDSDLQTLELCSGTATRIAAGESLTDGMSTGGDPEAGRRCAENAAGQIETLLSSVDLLMVIAGFGGGFGTGASPVVARMARQAGVATLFFTILPFPCEGAVVRDRARNAIHRLRTYADAMVQMPNALIQPDGEVPVEESLQRSSRILAEGVVGLWRLLHHTGVCNLDFASLHTLLNYCDACCRFACASAAGDERAAEVIELLHRHPLMQEGSVFEKAPGMIIGITGGEDLRLSEVQQITAALSPESETCWIKTGIAIDPVFAGRISVILLAAEGWKEPLVDDGRGGLKPPAGEGRQGELGLIGRRPFGGAERTVWRGEDLDIPSYIRRKIKIPR
jgi:cell division protein FtsZ